MVAAAIAATLVFSGTQPGTADTVGIEQIGVLAWVTILVTVSGLGLAGREARVAWGAFGLFGAFVAWTALSLAWSESPERTVLELGHALTAFGVLAVLVAARRSYRARWIAMTLAGAVAIISLIALVDDGLGGPLAGPMGSAPALGALAALALPPALYFATESRSARRVYPAAGSVVLLTVTVVLSGSRLALVASVVGVLAYLAVTHGKALVAAVKRSKPTLLVVVGTSLLVPGAVALAVAERFSGLAASKRAGLWEVALDQFASAPLLGTGPGSFELWNDRAPGGVDFAVGPRSLAFGTLGESGIVGLLLLAGFLALVVAISWRRARTGDGPERRLYAALGAGCLACAVTAAGTAAWEVPVVSIAFCVAAAPVLAVPSRRAGPARKPKAGRSLWQPRGAWAALSVAALAGLAIPLASNGLILESRELAREGDLQAALDRAASAGAITPSSARAPIQEALVYEHAGSFFAATSAARRAARNDPQNWRPWLILGRLLAKQGQGAAALDSIRRARRLNRRSPLFE